MTLIGEAQFCGYRRDILRAALNKCGRELKTGCGNNRVVGGAVAGPDSVPYLGIASRPPLKNKQAEGRDLRLLLTAELMYAPQGA